MPASEASFRRVRTKDDRSCTRRATVTRLLRTLSIVQIGPDTTERERERESRRDPLSRESGHALVSEKETRPLSRDRLMCVSALFLSLPSSRFVSFGDLLESLCAQTGAARRATRGRRTLYPRRNSKSPQRSRNKKSRKGSLALDTDASLSLSRNDTSRSDRKRDPLSLRPGALESRNIDAYRRVDTLSLSVGDPRS